MIIVVAIPKTFRSMNNDIKNNKYAIGGSQRDYMKPNISSIKPNGSNTLRPYRNGEGVAGYRSDYLLDIDRDDYLDTSRHIPSSHQKNIIDQSWTGNLDIGTIGQLDRIDTIKPTHVQLVKSLIKNPRGRKYLDTHYSAQPARTDTNRASSYLGQNGQAGNEMWSGNSIYGRALKDYFLSQGAPNNYQEDTIRSNVQSGINRNTNKFYYEKSLENAILKGIFSGKGVAK